MLYLFLLFPRHILTIDCDCLYFPGGTSRDTADEEETKNLCLEVLNRLQRHEYGYVFANPVDTVELGLPDYFDVIKKPMDFGTIQKNIDRGSYHSFDAFKLDVQLTFDNAMEYNMETTRVHEMAKKLKNVFEADIKRLSLAVIGHGQKMPATSFSHLSRASGGCGDDIIRWVASFVVLSSRAYEGAREGVYVCHMQKEHMKECIYIICSMFCACILLYLVASCCCSLSMQSICKVYAQLSDLGYET